MVTIPTSTRQVEYAPVAAAGPFPVPFPLFDADGLDLQIKLNGLIVTNWSFVGTLEEGFFGAPNTWVNGNVTFDVAITGALIIKGRRAPRRVAQYQEGRGVPARDLNTEYNLLTAVDQELRRDLDNIIVDQDAIDAAVAAAEAAAAIAVPAAADAEAARDIAIAAAGTNLVNYQSRTVAAATTIPLILAYAITAGYAAAGDGGGARYKRVVSEPAHPGKFQSADGAWWEIAEAILSPKMLGAKGDGTTNDYSSMADTVATGKAQGVGIDGGDRTYKINTALNLDGVPIQNAKIDGTGVTVGVTFPGLSPLKCILYRAGPVMHTATASLLTAQASPGNYAVNVANGALFAQGDVIVFRSTKNFDNTGEAKTSEWCRVRSVSGNTLQLDQPVVLTYELANSGQVSKLSATYTQIMRNVTVTGSGSPNEQFGFWGEYLHSPVFDDCKFIGCHAAALTCLESWAPVITSLHVVDSDMDGNGYGVNFGGCGNSVIGQLFAANTRHAVTLGAGGSRGASYYIMGWNCAIGQIAAPGSRGAILDSHPGFINCSVDSIVGNVRAYAQEDGVMIQGANFRIGHIDIAGDMQSGMTVQYFGSVGILNPYFIVDSLNAKIPFSTDGDGWPLAVLNQSTAHTIGLVKVGALTADTTKGVLIQPTGGAIESVEIGPGVLTVVGGHGVDIQSASGTAWTKRVAIRGLKIKGAATAGTRGVSGASAVASGGRVYVEAMSIEGFGHSLVAADMIVRRNDVVCFSFATAETSTSGGGSIQTIAP